MSLPSYKINNSYTIYVNYHYLNDCINTGKKTAAQKKKLEKEFEEFRKKYFSNAVKTGSKVHLQDMNTGLRSTITIISSNSFVPGTNTVSSASPVGKALLGRIVGETITVEIPGGIFRCRIQKIQ